MAFTRNYDNYELESSNRSNLNEENEQFDFEYIQPKSVPIAFIIAIYAIVSAVGILGNLNTLAKLIGRHRIFNGLIVGNSLKFYFNLSFIELVTATLIAPLLLYSLLGGRRIQFASNEMAWGTLLICNVTPILRITCFLAELLNHLLIAFDRFRFLVLQKSSELDPACALTTILIISIILSLPITLEFLNE